MDMLLQRIEGEELEAMSERLRRSPGPFRPFHQSRVDGAGEKSKTRALGRKPMLEARFADRQALHELATDERGGMPKRVFVLGSRHGLQRLGVDPGRSRHPGDRLLGGDDRLRRSVGKSSAQLRQRLPEAAAGLLLASLAPEKAGEHAAWDFAALPQRQIADQGASLLRGHGHRLAVMDDGHRPQKANAQASRTLGGPQLSNLRCFDAGYHGRLTTAAYSPLIGERRQGDA